MEDTQNAKIFEELKVLENKAKENGKLTANNTYWKKFLETIDYLLEDGGILANKYVTEAFGNSAAYKKFQNINEDVLHNYKYDDNKFLAHIGGSYASQTLDKKNRQHNNYFKVQQDLYKILACCKTLNKLKKLSGLNDLQDAFAGRVDGMDLYRGAYALSLAGIKDELRNNTNNKNASSGKLYSKYSELDVAMVNLLDKETQKQYNENLKKIHDEFA